MHSEDRQAIIDRLEKTGRSRYWLALKIENDGVCSRQTVYRYLRGEILPNTKFIQAMATAVGLRRKVTPVIDQRRKPKK